MGLQKNYSGIGSVRVETEPGVGKLEDGFSSAGTPHLHRCCAAALVVLIPLLRFTRHCKKLRSDCCRVLWKTLSGLGCIYNLHYGKGDVWKEPSQIALHKSR